MPEDLCLAEGPGRSYHLDHALIGRAFLVSAADRRALWALVKDRGERRPVLVAEELQEGAGTNEELHYGLFDRFEAYERQAPGSTRWSLSMTEWV